MKKINFLQFGLAFAGSFLGAGYVSGQELWQFFGSFGGKGIFGLFIAIALLFAVGLMMVRLNQFTGYAEADKLVVRRDAPLLRGAVVVLELIFLFGVVVIMTAGVGALLNQLFGFPLWMGALIFIAAVALCSLAGLSGMVSAFSMTVPVLAGVTLIFGIISVSKGGFCVPQAVENGANPLMGSWPVAAITFACYNIFGSVAIVAPLGGHIKSRRHTYAGMLSGALILLLIAGSVLVSLGAFPEVTQAELPMLALASGFNPALGYIYALLLLFAMFGTALSSMVAFTNLICLKSRKISEHRVGFIIICALLCFAGSLFGFGDLISIIYPVFGYLSSVFIVLMATHYIKERRMLHYGKTSCSGNR